MLLWTGCSQKTIVQTKYIKQDIPNHLFECPEVKKPVAKNGKDIIKAYVDLYQSYSTCKTSLESIRELTQ